MFKWLTNFINSFFSTIGKAVKKIGRILNSIGREGIDLFFEEIKEFATNVVKSFMNQAMNNNLKHIDAFELIKKEADKRKIFYHSNWINILIPIVLEALKKEFE